MNHDDLGRCLDGAVKQYDLRHHPLYQAWMFGVLTSDDLRKYSLEYYHHLAAFPRYLREFARRLPNGELRNQVFQILWEEEGKLVHGPRARVAIWSSFAAVLGADTTLALTQRPLPKTHQLIEIYMELARSGSNAEALAAFYAYHSLASRIATHKAAALRNHYGISDDAVELFVCQGEVYARHASAWRSQLFEILGNDPAALPYSLIAADLAAKALWRALDGIHSQRTSQGCHSHLTDGASSLRTT